MPICKITGLCINIFAVRRSVNRDVISGIVAFRKKCCPNACSLIIIGGFACARTEEKPKFRRVHRCKSEFDRLGSPVADLREVSYRICVINVRPEFDASVAVRRGFHVIDRFVILVGIVVFVARNIIDLKPYIRGIIAGRICGLRMQNENPEISIFPVNDLIFQT